MSVTDDDRASNYKYCAEVEYTVPGSEDRERRLTGYCRGARPEDTGQTAKAGWTRGNRVPRNRPRARWSVRDHHGCVLPCRGDGARRRNYRGCGLVSSTPRSVRVIRRRRIWPRGSGWCSIEQGLRARPFARARCSCNVEGQDGLPTLRPREPGRLWGASVARRSRPYPKIGGLCQPPAVCRVPKCVGR